MAGASSPLANGPLTVYVDCVQEIRGVSTVCSAQSILIRNDGISENGPMSLKRADDYQSEDNFPVSMGQNSENQVGFDAPPSMMMTIIQFAKMSLVVLMITHLR